MVTQSGRDDQTIWPRWLDNLAEMVRQSGRDDQTIWPRWLSLSAKKSADSKPTGLDHAALSWIDLNNATYLVLELIEKKMLQNLDASKIFRSIARAI